MFNLPFWLLWGSLQWDIIYSVGLYILILCAHFKRFIFIFLLQILSPDLNLVSSKSLTIQSSLWLVSMNHCWFIAWPFLLLGNFKYTTWCYWKDFLSLLFFRITSQWDPNIETVLLNSVSILCRIIRKPGLPISLLILHAILVMKRKETM